MYPSFSYIFLWCKSRIGISCWMNCIILHSISFIIFWQDCVGVVDSTHIPVMVGVDEQGPFRNEKGLLSQNVLAACSFDMKFHYVLAGWEGSAPDMQVLHSALTRSYSLQIPEGRAHHLYCDLLKSCSYTV